MMRTLAAASVVLGATTLLGWAAPVTAQSPAEPITISGQVVNRTEGGDPVEELSVVLHHNTATELGESRVTVGPDGLFAFDDVVPRPDVAYGVSVLYKGALYGINLDLTVGQPEPIELAIYEPIRSDEVIRAELVSVLINEADPVSQTLSVLEIARLVNDSEFTYVPGPEPMQIIRFALPESSSDLRVDTSLLIADIFQVDRGFGLSASLPPGTHEVLYSYRFPYSDATEMFSRTLRYGAESLRFVVPAAIAGIGEATVGMPEAVEIGEVPYTVVEATNVPRGHELGVALTELPTPRLGDRLSNAIDTLRWEFAAPVALGVIVAVVAGYALWRNRGRSVKSLKGSTPDDEREAILGMIADLDESRRSGEVNGDEHRRRRSVLTTRLARLQKAGTVPEDG